MAHVILGVLYAVKDKVINPTWDACIYAKDSIKR